MVYKNGEIVTEIAKDPAAVSLGRKGGSVKSPAKSVSSVANGSAPCKEGKVRGRPRKTPTK